MARKYRSPWYVSSRWHVEALMHGQWKPIYMAKTKKAAKEDGAEWFRKTGQQIRIVPGSGHKSKR